MWLERATKALKQLSWPSLSRPSRLGKLIARNFQPLVLGEHRDAMFLGFSELRARAGARDDVIGLLRHGARYLRAKALGHRPRLLARHLLRLENTHLLGQALDDAAIVALAEISSHRLDHRIADLVKRIHVGNELLVAFRDLQT